MSKLTLSEAFEGFILDKQASGRSLHTISSYRNSISKALTFFDSDPVVQSMRRQDWIRFFAWLQDEHVSVPGGVAPRPPCHLSPKSVANIHTDLSAFYTWATSPGVELVGDHILRTIDRPRFERPLIETFTKAEIAALLKACDDGRAVNLSGEHRVRSTRHRDRAIIHVLLSTGVRASELCDMRVKDLDLNAKSIHVAGKGKGRDSKPRTVYFGRTASTAIWRYLSPYMKELRPDDPLFPVDLRAVPRPMTRDVLRKLLARIGERAGIEKVYPHRFRHTFATEFLRNVGDVLKLKVLMGHSTLAMVERYAHVLASDAAKAHQGADPADNWRVQP